MKEVVTVEILKCLDVGVIFPIFDSVRIRLIYVVPKKGEITIVQGKDNEMIPSSIMV